MVEDRDLAATEHQPQQQVDDIDQYLKDDLAPLDEADHYLEQDAMPPPPPPPSETEEGGANCQRNLFGNFQTPPEESDEQLRESILSPNTLRAAALE